MRVIAGLMAGLLAGVPLAGAAAQFQSGEPRERERAAVKVMAEADALRVMDAFARCVAEREAASAQAMLALPYGSPEQEQAALGFSSDADACVSVQSHGHAQVMFKPRALAGGMAQHFVDRRFDAERLRALTPEQLASPQLAPRNGLEAFGQCVVLQDPVAVHAFLQTPVASEREREAGARLAQPLAACVTAGQRLALNVAALRQLLAVSSYRLLSGTSRLASR